MYCCRCANSIESFVCMKNEGVSFVCLILKCKTKLYSNDVFISYLTRVARVEFGSRSNRGRIEYPISLGYSAAYQILISRRSIAKSVVQYPGSRSSRQVRIEAESSIQARWDTLPTVSKYNFAPKFIEEAISVKF